MVSIRAECVPENFESGRDPEGVEFARSVNKHLPDDVRVFSAQRVNGGWCARGMCEAREYEYTLPARILLPRKQKKEEWEEEKGGENGNESESAELEAAVARLEEVLALYLGQRPFHNFTVRREYRSTGAGGSGSMKEPRESRRQRLGRREGSGSGADSAAATRSNDSEGEETSEGAAAARQQQQRASSSSSPSPSPAPSPSSSSGSFSFSAGGPCGSKRPSASSSTSSLEEESEDQQPRPLPFFVRPLWLEETPAGDKVGPAHWRRVDSAEVVFPERRGTRSRDSASPSPAAAAALVPGGEPALTVRISGGSFMLRQLRHMIGAAVAVARGSLPSPAVVAAALRVPARLSLPLAPPHTLVLTGARFGAYPAKALAPGDVAPWQGERLELRRSNAGDGSEGAGERAARAFRETRLAAALDELLKHEDWGLWAEQLDRLRWDEAEMAEFVARAEADARSAEERAEERTRERREGGGRGGKEGELERAGGGGVQSV